MTAYDITARAVGASPFRVTWGSRPPLPSSFTSLTARRKHLRPTGDRVGELLDFVEPLVVYPRFPRPDFPSTDELPVVVGIRWPPDQIEHREGRLGGGRGTADVPPF